MLYACALTSVGRRLALHARRRRFKSVSAHYAGLCLAARAARCKRVTKKHRWFESIIRHHACADRAIKLNLWPASQGRSGRAKDSLFVRVRIAEGMVPQINFHLGREIAPLKGSYQRAQPHIVRGI